MAVAWKVRVVASNETVCAKPGVLTQLFSCPAQQTSIQKGFFKLPWSLPSTGKVPWSCRSDKYFVRLWLAKEVCAGHCWG